MTIGNGRVDIGPSRITDPAPEPDPDRVYEQEKMKELEELQEEAEDDEE